MKKYYQRNDLIDLLIEKKEEMDINILKYNKTKNYKYVDEVGPNLRQICKIIYKYTEYAKKLNNLLDEEKDEIFGENYMKEIFNFVIEKYRNVYNSIIDHYNRTHSQYDNSRFDYMKKTYEEYMIPISYRLNIEIPYEHDALN